MFHRTTAFVSRPIGHPSAEIAAALASKPTGRSVDYGIQFALHVVDFNCRNALAHLRAIGACNRRVRKLTDDEFDDNMFNIENGAGAIY